VNDGGDFKFKNVQLRSNMRQALPAGAEPTGQVVPGIEEGPKRPGSSNPRWICQRSERQRPDCLGEKQKNNHPEDGVTQGTGNRINHVTAVEWIPISYTRC